MGDLLRVFVEGKALNENEIELIFRKAELGLRDVTLVSQV